MPPPQEELYFISVQHHHSATFCLFSSSFLPLSLTPGDVVEPHQKPYRKFTGSCVKIYRQCIVISWDALHNRCQRCLEWDSRMLCCFAELIKNVCVSVGLCVSEPLCIIVRSFWPKACCFLWDVAFPTVVSVLERASWSGLFAVPLHKKS